MGNTYCKSCLALNCTWQLGLHQMCSQFKNERNWMPHLKSFDDYLPWTARKLFHRYNFMFICCKFTLKLFTKLYIYMFDYVCSRLFQTHFYIFNFSIFVFNWSQEMYTANGCIAWNQFVDVVDLKYWFLKLVSIDNITKNNLLIDLSCKDIHIVLKIQV